MQWHDAAQTARLENYRAIRHYSVEYKGFSKTITAAMDVEVEYSAASGKSFRVLSQSGSSKFCEKVLMRALESEKEAAQNKSATALSPQNYQFSLVGYETLHGRPTYVLHIEPANPGKFLYRGKIWVDAEAFAPVKLEVEPAKNPSFWITHTAIQHINAPTNGFWLPQTNRSETKVRIGGTAVMTIDYGIYQIASKQSRAALEPLR
jgi:hypothetical protein